MKREANLVVSIMEAMKRFLSTTVGRWNERGASAVPMACALLCLSTTAYAQGVNVVYVESNIGVTPNQNSVFGFSNDGHGNLTALPGSPYLTGGTGFFDPHGGSIGTENQVIIRRDGNLLFAVNAHTNTIAVFNINADGSLMAVPGSPFGSNGVEPLSLALSDDFLGGDVDVLTVMNRAADPNQPAALPNFSTFRVSDNGALTPVSAVTLLHRANPTQVTTVGARGRFVIGAQVGYPQYQSMLYAYRMKSNGAMQTANQLSISGGSNLLGNVAHPTQPILYTGQPGNGIIAAAVGVYQWDQTTGALSLVGTVPNQGRSLCWLAINAAGTRLYAVENGSSSVSVYDLTNPDVPVQIQRVILIGTSPAPTNMKLDPTGTFAYVVDVGQQDLHVLNVDATTGMLTETIAPTPLPGLQAGEMPIGLATLLR